MGFNYEYLLYKNGLVNMKSMRSLKTNVTKRTKLKRIDSLLDALRNKQESKFRKFHYPIVMKPS